MPTPKTAADVMERSIHRAWVVKEGRPAGVVSSPDLLPLVRDE